MTATTIKWILVALLFNVLQENLAQYVPPTPTVEPLYPKGLRMSIPHEDGISLVAYHVKFNEDFEGLEAGTIARDIVKVKNGRWTYEDRGTKLKPGDTIYYWVHVVYDRLGYNLLDQQHVVTEFYNYDGTPMSSTPSGGCLIPSETKTYVRDEKTQQLRRNNVCSGQLIFEENFDSLDKNRWKIIERFSNPPNLEFVVYLNDEDNVYVKDGALHVKPVLTKDKFGDQFVQDGTMVLNKCTGEIDTRDCKRTALGWNILPPIASGRLNTKPSFNFLYGKIEIRAKLPRGDWIYPLITLESSDEPSNMSSFCNIIIAHSVGNPSLRLRDGQDVSSHLLMGGVHVINLSNINQQDNRLHLPSKISTSPWFDDYHVYELEWRNGQIILKVDGEQYGVQNVPAMYDIPVYLNVGVAVGGHVLFPDRSISGNYEKPWRNVASKALYQFCQAENNWLSTWRQGDTQLSIDYIKVRAI